jgi:hypothetical protein
MDEAIVSLQLNDVVKRSSSSAATRPASRAAERSRGVSGRRQAAQLHVQLRAPRGFQLPGREPFKKQNTTFKSKAKLGKSKSQPNAECRYTPKAVVV